MTSGSDFHEAGALAKGGIITEAKIETMDDLKTVLTCGNYSIIEN